MPLETMASIYILLIDIAHGFNSRMSTSIFSVLSLPSLTANNKNAHMYSLARRELFLTLVLLRYSFDKQFLTCAKNWALDLFAEAVIRWYFILGLPNEYSMPSPAISQWYLGECTHTAPNFLNVICNKLSSSTKSVHVESKWSRLISKFLTPMSVFCHCQKILQYYISANLTNLFLCKFTIFLLLSHTSFQ